MYPARCNTSKSRARWISVLRKIVLKKDKKRYKEPNDKKTSEKNYGKVSVKADIKGEAPRQFTGLLEKLSFSSRTLTLLGIYLVVGFGPVIIFLLFSFDSLIKNALKGPSCLIVFPAASLTLRGKEYNKTDLSIRSRYSREPLRIFPGTQT